MWSCSSCSASAADGATVCPTCLTPRDAVDAPTGTAPRPATPDSAAPRTKQAGAPKTPTPWAPFGSGGTGRAPTPPPGQGRFSPGDVLVDRYRIAGLLGKGGMGEVYRADDLKLGQTVALKFLPEALQDDEQRLERFYHEVKIAREVTHPAVCRVHDLGEIEGRPFLSMEYVDGENLSSLVRRIGRLPKDKAKDIGRQIALGLSAAHAKGVLHRDLKPDNVMLDGRGKVRITDFGLAAVVASVRGEDVKSGTPAYMSPEQLAGREVTFRSDVYSLGLVLFELFTGRRAFEGRTVSELARKHQEEAPPRPSSLVDDLEPAVEQVVLQCLEKDPGGRPPSALAVAAALTGGDVLAAALAAGETPSPEMVAASGRRDGLSPWKAWTAAALVAASFAATPLLTQGLALVWQVPLEKPPAVLEDKARELFRRLGQAAPAVDQASGLTLDRDYLRFAAERDTSSERWTRLRTGEPAVVQFWYREAPRELLPAGRGNVRWLDPPLDLSGMRSVRYDMRGRLLELYVVTPQRETAVEEARAPDWASLFTEAGLDVTRFQPVTPEWTPPYFCDTRAAWVGTYPTRTEIPLRIEAGAHRGQVVFFTLVAPWTRPGRMETFQYSRGLKSAQIVGTTAFLGITLASALLAWRHFRGGRGDRRGALRLASYTLVVGLVADLIRAHHVTDRSGELGLLARAVGNNLVVGLLIWTFYLALEPWVRRLWPHTIVSWTRLLGGSLRDPLVGRDVLLGTASGAVLAVAGQIVEHLLRGLGYSSMGFTLTELAPLLGLAETLGSMADLQIQNALAGIGILLLLLLLRVVLRRTWLAVGVLVLIMSLQQVLVAELPTGIGLLVMAPLMALPVALLARVGLLATITLFWTGNLLGAFPLTLNLGGWTGGPTIATGLLLAAVVATSLRASGEGPNQ